MRTITNTFILFAFCLTLALMLGAPGFAQEEIAVECPAETQYIEEWLPLNTIIIFFAKPLLYLFFIWLSFSILNILMLMAKKVENTQKEQTEKYNLSIERQKESLDLEKEMLEILKEQNKLLRNLVEKLTEK